MCGSNLSSKLSSLANVQFQNKSLLNLTVHCAQGFQDASMETLKTREFQTQLLHDFTKSDNKSNHHHPRDVEN